MTKLKSKSDTRDSQEDAKPGKAQKCKGPREGPVIAFNSRELTPSGAGGEASDAKPFGLIEKPLTSDNKKVKRVAAAADNTGDTGWPIYPFPT